MSIKIYRDIYINKGADFSEVIDINADYDDVNLTGAIKSSYASPVSFAFSFLPVEGQPTKARVTLSALNTLLLPRRRGVYDIYSVSKETDEVLLNRQGIAHYTDSASFSPAVPPPPGYTILARDVIGLGSAALVDTEDLEPVFDETTFANIDDEFTDLIIKTELDEDFNIRKSVFYGEFSESNNSKSIRIATNTDETLFFIGPVTGGSRTPWKIEMLERRLSEDHYFVSIDFSTNVTRSHEHFELSYIPESILLSAQGEADDDVMITLSSERTY
jgi:hypothetical protein